MIIQCIYQRAKDAIRKLVLGYVQTLKLLALFGVLKNLDSICVSEAGFFQVQRLELRFFESDVGEKLLCLLSQTIVAQINFFHVHTDVLDQSFSFLALQSVI